MKKIVAFSFLLFLLVISAGCGANNPGGVGGIPVAPGTAALTMTVNFPQKPAAPAGLMGLISANTTTIEIHISTGSTYNSAAVIASTAVVAPVGGGPVTTNIVLTNPPATVISVEIVAKDSAGNWLGEVRELNKTLVMGGTTPINATMVELNQGIDMIALSIPVANRPVVYGPGGVSYTVNKVFLQSTVSASGATVYSMIAETDKTFAGTTTLNLAVNTVSGTVIRTDTFVSNGIITGTFTFQGSSVLTSDYMFSLDFSGLNNIPNLTITPLAGSTAPLNPVITKQWANNITPTVLVQMGGAKQGRVLVLSNALSVHTGTTGVLGSADGVGAAASFHWPWGITTDGTNLYVCDHFNHTIRQISLSTGTVTTIGGTAGLAGSVDGIGIAARFNAPIGIVADGAGNLYIADAGNNMIRKMSIATGVVTTIAGSTAVGYLDGTGLAARFNQPSGITMDTAGNLYVSEVMNNTIRKIVVGTGIVTTVAGNTIAGWADGTGTAATFTNPFGLTTDGTNLYIADSNSAVIRKIVIATGVVTTIAGTGGSFANLDGTGIAARFSRPMGITSDGSNLYISDEGNWNVRQINIATGVVTTIGTVGGSNDGITTDGMNLYMTVGSNNPIGVNVIEIIK